MLPSTRTSRPRLILVAGIMFLAMMGQWGTHYDYVGMPPEFQMGLWRGFFWLAFFPQLVFWVLFTMVLGAVSGTLTALLASARVKSPPAFAPR